MLGEVLTGDCSITGNDIDNARRKADLPHQLCNLERTQRSEFSRFQNDTIARRQRGTHLPAREHDRKIPRDDLPDHSEWLSQHIIQEALLHRYNAPLKLVGQAPEVAKGRGGAWNIQPARVADW